MPFAQVDGTRIYYRLEGLPERPLLILSQSLGCDHGMWDVQMERLLQRFRVLRYDTRGHGASDVPPGDYALPRLAQDVLDLADSLDIEQFDFCGLSLGGMTGQWLAAFAAHRLRSLVLANTSAHFPDPTMIAPVKALMGNRVIAQLEQNFFFQERIKTLKAKWVNTSDLFRNILVELRESERKEVV